MEDTVATAGVEDVQGLVDAGLGEPFNWVVAPAHTTRLPDIVGSGLTVTALVVLEQPVVVEVNVNVADPADTPRHYSAICNSGNCYIVTYPVHLKYVLVTQVRLWLLPQDFLQAG